MLNKTIIIAAIAVCLCFAVACNTSWTTVAADILDAATPTLALVVPPVAPIVQVVSSGLRSWNGTESAMTNIVNELNTAVNNIDILVPGLGAYDKQLAQWCAAGLESVLKIIGQHLPNQAQGKFKAAAVQPKNLGQLPFYPNAKAFKAAKP